MSKNTNCENPFRHTLLRAMQNRARSSVLRMRWYIQLVRLDKPVGIWLLLWPTLNAVWIATQGHPSWHLLFVFVVGTILMRSAGCAINDYADRNFDRHVARTRDRPLTTGRITVYEALGITFLLTLLAAALILPFNRLTQILAGCAAVLAASYPFTKRYMALPQAYLGLAFGFGIPMSFAAMQGKVPGIAYAMVGANIAWSLAYDTEYAMVDRKDDILLGIQTSALTFGRYDVHAIMVCYGLFLGVYGVLGWVLHYTWPFWLGWVLAILCAGYHFSLIRTRAPERCFAAFRHNVWLGAALFLGIAGHYTFVHLGM
jgi:4-hydroxybenzoate polyprenyltransferase